MPTHKGGAILRDDVTPRTSHDRDADLPRELLTVNEVAALLHVPVSWVYEHTRRGASDALPVVKVGKYVRFRPADFWNYIDSKCRIRTSR